jgi:hypothetical protein
MIEKMIGKRRERKTEMKVKIMQLINGRGCILLGRVVVGYPLKFYTVS